MANIEEINGISATSVFRIIGYSADERGMELSISNDVRSYLKSYPLSINYTEKYFFEEFWFYFITAAQVNYKYPIIQFCMNNQLTPSELAQTNVQSVYNAMRSLAFVLPRDRAKLVDIDISVAHSSKEFEDFHKARFSEYYSLLESNSYDKVGDLEQDDFIETYVHYLSSSVGFNDDELVKMAFRYALIGNYKVYYADLRDYVLKHL